MSVHMIEEINIRTANIDDLDNIFCFVCELENEKFDYETFKSIFIENICNENNIYLLTETNSKAVGYISYHSQNLLHHCGKVGEILELYVVRNFRGKGIGRRLISELGSKLKGSEIKSLEVTSNVRRKENILFYEKAGFKLFHHKNTLSFDS